MIAITVTRSPPIGVAGKTQHHKNSEVAADVISSVAVDYIGTDVLAKFGDCRINSSRIIQLFGRPDPFYALLCSI